MKLAADSGLWTTGPALAPAQLDAVLEVSGAVLSWTVDDPSGAAAARLTFTDLTRADWLWRVVGASAHVSLAAALAGRSPDEAQGLELSEVDLVPGTVEALRRLAVGHWLRRWWPASERDGIAGLDPALLDAEIAVLTAHAQDFFTDDTLDSDVRWLLAPHAWALADHVAGADPRVLELVGVCVDLADEVGAGGTGWPELAGALDDSRRLGGDTHAALRVGRADDYALAAGPGASPSVAGAIASGVGSVSWAAVPPGTFDAAENTVDWSIVVVDAAPVVLVRVATLGPGNAAGVAVRLQSGAVSGVGVLDAEGRAVLPVVDAARQPMTESAAWDRDWSTGKVTVGADVTEPPEIRERIRRFARARLTTPGADAFLAEILAAESDY